MREIRMLRTMRRKLETGPRNGLRHRKNGESLRQTATPRSCRHRASFRPYDQAPTRLGVYLQTGVQVRARDAECLRNAPHRVTSLIGEAPSKVGFFTRDRSSASLRISASMVLRPSIRSSSRTRSSRRRTSETLTTALVSTQGSNSSLCSQSAPTIQQVGSYSPAACHWPRCSRHSGGSLQQCVVFVQQSTGADAAFR